MAKTPKKKAKRITRKPEAPALDSKAKQELAVREIMRILAENNLTLKINHEILIIPKN